MIWKYKNTFEIIYISVGVYMMMLYILCSETSLDCMGTTYIYIYIYGDREREIEIFLYMYESPDLSMTYFYLSVQSSYSVDSVEIYRAHTIIFIHLPLFSFCLTS